MSESGTSFDEDEPEEDYDSLPPVGTDPTAGLPPHLAQVAAAVVAASANGNNNSSSVPESGGDAVGFPQVGGTAAYDPNDAETWPIEKRLENLRQLLETQRHPELTNQARIFETKRGKTFTSAISRHGVRVRDAHPDVPGKDRFLFFCLLEGCCGRKGYGKRIAIQETSTKNATCHLAKYHGIVSTHHNSAAHQQKKQENRDKTMTASPQHLPASGTARLPNVSRAVLPTATHNPKDPNSVENLDMAGRINHFVNQILERKSHPELTPDAMTNQARAGKRLTSYISEFGVRVVDRDPVKETDRLFFFCLLDGCCGRHGLGFKISLQPTSTKNATNHLLQVHNISSAKRQAQEAAAALKANEGGLGPPPGITTLATRTPSTSGIKRDYRSTVGVQPPNSAPSALASSRTTPASHTSLVNMSTSTPSAAAVMDPKQLAASIRSLQLTLSFWAAEQSIPASAFATSSWQSIAACLPGGGDMVESAGLAGPSSPAMPSDRSAPALMNLSVDRFLIEQYQAIKDKIISKIHWGRYKYRVPFLTLHLDLQDGSVPTWSKRHPASDATTPPTFVTLRASFVVDQHTFSYVLALRPYSNSYSRRCPQKAEEQLWVWTKSVLDEFGVQETDLLTGSAGHFSDLQAVMKRLIPSALRETSLSDMVNRSLTQALGWTRVWAQHNNEENSVGKGESNSANIGSNPEVSDLLLRCGQMLQTLLSSHRSTFIQRSLEEHYDRLEQGRSLFHPATSSLPSWKNCPQILESILMCWFDLEATFRAKGQSFPLDDGDKRVLTELYSLALPLCRTEELLHKKSFASVECYLEICRVYNLCLRPTSFLVVLDPVALRQTGVDVGTALARGMRGGDQSSNQVGTSRLESSRLHLWTIQTRERLRQAVNAWFMHRYHPVFALKDPARFYAPTSSADSARSTVTLSDFCFGYVFEMQSMLAPNNFLRDLHFIGKMVDSVDIGYEDVQAYLGNHIPGANVQDQISNLREMHAALIRRALIQQARQLGLSVARALRESSKLPKKNSRTEPRDSWISKPTKKESNDDGNLGDDSMLDGPAAKRQRRDGGPPDLVADAFGLGPIDDGKAGTADAEEGEDTITEQLAEQVDAELEKFGTWKISPLSCTFRGSDEVLEWWGADRMKSDFPILSKIAGGLFAMKPGSSALGSDCIDVEGIQENVAAQNYGPLRHGITEAIMMLRLNKDFFAVHGSKDIPPQPDTWRDLIPVRPDYPEGYFDASSAPENMDVEEATGGIKNVGEVANL